MFDINTEVAGDNRMVRPSSSLLALLVACSTAFAATAEEGDKLTAMRATYEHELKKLVDDDIASLTSLRDGYTAALDKVMLAIQKSGDFGAWHVAKAEKERFAARQDVSDTDVVEAPIQLRNLQAEYRTSLDRITLRQAQRFSLLASRYADALSRLRGSLTREGDMADAAAVNEEMKKLDGDTMIAKARATVAAQREEEAAAQREKELASRTKREKILALDPLDRGLLLHYTFDEKQSKTTTDRSGHDNHGTLKNGTRHVPAIVATGLQVIARGTTDGATGGHVLLPHIDFRSLNAFTISLWVREERMHFPHGESYIVFGVDPNTVEIGHRALDSHEDGVIYRIGPGQISVDFPASDLDRFVLHSLVYKDGMMKAYRDGRLEREIPTTVPATATEAALARHWWNLGGLQSSTRISATFDDVRIYDRGLSPPEIMALYEMKK